MSDLDHPDHSQAAPASQENFKPSLIIAPRHEDVRRHPPQTMGKPDFYGGEEALPTTQRLLLDGCEEIRSTLAASSTLGSTPLQIGLAQLTLHVPRVAKSHRPVETFNQDSCPVIGDTDGLGKFLVVVTPDGLAQLEQSIQHPATARAAAHLTSVAAFTSLDARYRLTLPMERAIRGQLQRDGSVRVKVRLPRFELFTPLFQTDLEATFRSMDGIHEAPYLMLGDFLIYGADVTNFEQVTRIAALPFIERVEVMPRYRPVQVTFAGDADARGDGTESLGLEVRLGPIPDGLPTVVVADTGVPCDGPLAPLVRERASFIADTSDPAHASWVAALAAAQRGSLATGLLSPRATIVDARVFRNADESVLEDEMSQRIQAAVRQFGPTHKVWNFSMASEPGPRLPWHSDLGQRMDELRHEYNLIFVSAAGNRRPNNLRTAFPPVTEDEDWISAPGDALRNITATSLAPDDTSASFGDAYARPHEPSPFAGRGLSPEGALLPLVAEYGGNMTRAGNPIGILSVDTRGHLCPVIGTSMAAPLIAGALAELAQCFALSLAQQDLISDFDPLLLAKTALFHNSRIPPIMSGGANLGEYFGFGVPPTLEELTGDQAWRGTIFLATTIAPDGNDLVIDPLPFPDVLRLGDYCRGEILATLVTEPLLGSGKIREYVRSDIELKLGPATENASGEISIKPNQLCLDTRFPAARFEVERIRREQKWSPFRRYYVRLTEAGIKAPRWALSAHMLLRAEEQQRLREARDDHRHRDRYLDLVELHRMQIVIAVTILDPQQIAPVRDQILHQWQVRGNIPTQIAIAPRLRSRFVTQ